MTQEALKMALEALEKNTKHLPADFDYHFEAITAIKEALANHIEDNLAMVAAQPEQEPVAYLCEPDENGLYGLPLTEKTCTKCFPVYRHPQRTWVGLTDDEIFEIRMHSIQNMGANFQETLCKAIEAKLKERNT